MPNAQLPAHLQRLAGRGMATDLARNLASQAVPHISIRANRFTLVDAAGNKQPVPTFHLDVVIVDANPNKSKIYYAEAFDPSADEFKPPLCFSDNGVAPSAQAAEPQNPTCSACPFNQWGSDVSRVSGKRTKACNDVQKIAVFLPENPAMVFLLRVPPASLKQLGNYVKTVMGNGADLNMVITRVGFDEQTQGILNFASVNWIDEKQAVRVEEIINGKLADTLLGKDDVPYQGAIAAPKQQAQLAAPVAQQVAPPPPMQQPAFQPPPVQQFAPSPAMPAVQAVAQAQAPWNNPPPNTQAFPAPQAQPVQAVVNEAPKRTRRTKAEMEAARAAEGQAQPVQAQAPTFMQQSPPTQQPAFMQQAPQPAPAPTSEPLEIPAFLRKGMEPAAAPQPSYGMQQAPAPSPELQAALTAALNLPTG